MKKHLTTIIVIVIFICGLSLFLYPTFSNLYNRYRNQQLIGDYQELSSDITIEEYNEALENAKAYNQYKDQPQKLAELGLTYENVLNIAKNGVMGYIEIPKISVSLVIYHSIDENVLQSGIGHVEQTALPIGGESTHCVLAGHTGLPSAKLLTNIDHLKIGDVFYIHVLDEDLEYRIDDISVVEPDEVSRLNVISGKDHVTLVTCTPYGVNSHRLLVRGVRVEEGASTEIGNTDHIQNDLLQIEMKYLIPISLLGLFILIFAIYKLLALRKRRKNNPKKKKSNTAKRSEE